MPHGTAGRPILKVTKFVSFSTIRTKSSLLAQKVSTYMLYVTTLRLRSHSSHYYCQEQWSITSTSLEGRSFARYLFHLCQPHTGFIIVLLVDCCSYYGKVIVSSGDPRTPKGISLWNDVDFQDNPL